MEHDHSSSEAEPVGPHVSGIAEIVKAMVTALLPSIITEVQRAVGDASQMNMESIQDEIKTIHENMKGDKVLAKMNEDRLEKYSRRENICIVGVKERDGESEEMLVSAVRDIAAETGVQLGG